MSFYYKPAEAALIRSQNERARMDIKAINSYRSFGDGTSTTTPFLYTNEQIQELSRQLQEEEQRKRRAAQWHRIHDAQYAAGRDGEGRQPVGKALPPSDDDQARQHENARPDHHVDDTQSKGAGADHPNQSFVFHTI